MISKKTLLVCILLVPFVAAQTKELTPINKEDQYRELGYKMQQAVLSHQNLNEVKEILKQGFNINDPIGCGTFCAVDGAISLGDVDMLKLLIDYGAKLPERSLANAAFNPDESRAYELVSILLDGGLSPNAKEYYDEKRYTVALHNASWRGHLKVVTLLLSQPNIELNHLSVDGDSALIAAIKQKHYNVAKELMEKGADINIKMRKGKYKDLTAKEILALQIQDHQKLLSLFP